jgi:hypothetical protein
MNGTLSPDSTELPAGLEKQLEVLASGQLDGIHELLPWFTALPEAERTRLSRDLTLLFQEPEATGEPLDWPEVFDLLREFAVIAGWDGPVLVADERDAVATDANYRVDLRPQDARALGSASAAVQRAAREAIDGFLAVAPTDADRLLRGDLKKMRNRHVWQIDLPDGYRLRYLVDEPARVVYVVYLGPHPDGAMEGRERAVRAKVQRRRHEGGG